MARTTVVGACPHDCPDTCSILTTVEDGKAIAVRGNPDHPFTRGRLCVKVNNYEERVYSDKRVLYPLKRVGPRAPRQFQRISWDEAIETIAIALEAIIAEHGAQAILPYSYLGTQGIINGLNVGDPLLQQARRHRVGAHVLRFRLVHGLYDDDRSHARGRSRKLRALEIHRAVGVQHARAPTRITGRSSSRPGRPGPSSW